MELLLLELLRVLSLTLSILMIPFEVGPWEGLLILLYTMVVLSLFLWKKIRKKPYSLALIPLVAGMPLMSFFTKERVYFSLLYSGILFVYYEVRLGILDPKDLSQRFKVSYGLLLLFGLAAASSSGIRWILLQNLPFLLFYFFTTILLSASLRHKEAGIDPKKSRVKIVRYLLISIVGAVFLGTVEVRTFILEASQKIGELILILVFYIVYPVAYAVFYLIKKFYRAPDLTGAGAVPVGEGLQEEFGEALGKAREHPALTTILSLLLIIAFIYLIYRFLRKKGEKEVEGLEYIEERQSLKGEKPRKKRIKEKEPQEIYEKFRFRYKRYLMALKKQMEIRASDTARDVAVRAQNISSKNHNRIMKDYQEVRYGEKAVTDEVLETFSRYLEEDHNE